MKFIPIYTSMGGIAPKYVFRQKIEARSPLHAGLILAKKLSPNNKDNEIGIVVMRLSDKKNYELHVRKRNVGGRWVYHGQVYQGPSNLQKIFT